MLYCPQYGNYVSVVLLVDQYLYKFLIHNISLKKTLSYLIYKYAMAITNIKVLPIQFYVISIYQELYYIKAI